MTELFPEGTGGAPSEARATVWTRWEEFSELAEQLGVYAEGLAGAADNGLMGAGDTMSAGSMMGGSSDMMGGGAGMMGGGMTAEQIAEMPADGAYMMLALACTACHTQFRAEGK